MVSSDKREAGSPTQGGSPQSSLPRGLEILADGQFLTRGRRQRKREISEPRASPRGEGGNGSEGWEFSCFCYLYLEMCLWPSLFSPQFCHP